MERIAQRCHSCDDLAAHIGERDEAGHGAAFGDDNCAGTSFNPSTASIISSPKPTSQGVLEVIKLLIGVSYVLDTQRRTRVQGECVDDLELTPGTQSGSGHLFIQLLSRLIDESFKFKNEPRQRDAAISPGLAQVLQPLDWRHRRSPNEVVTTRPSELTTTLRSFALL
jgi:hypothetical protein